MSAVEFLEPITETKPAGDDVQFPAECAAIQQLQLAGRQAGISAVAQVPDTDWAEIARLAWSVLKEKSQDLPVAIGWVEARLAKVGASRTLEPNNDC